MKKLFNSLPFRLLLGIFVGIILGQIFNESTMGVVVTLQYIMGQLITCLLYTSPSPRDTR